MMAREVRPDPRPHDSGNLGCAALLVSFALIVLASITTERAAPGPVAAVGGLGVVAWVAHQLARHFRPYRCPGCGDRLKKTFLSEAAPGGREDGGPIHCVCPWCDVEWDTGSRWTNNANWLDVGSDNGGYAYIEIIMTNRTIMRAVERP
jgi:hypothetical protein